MSKTMLSRLLGKPKPKVSALETIAKLNEVTPISEFCVIYLLIHLFTLQCIPVSYLAQEFYLYNFFNVACLIV